MFYLLHKSQKNEQKLNLKFLKFKLIIYFEVPKIFLEDNILI